MFATSLIKSATQRVRVTAEVNWIGKSATPGALQPPTRHETVQRRTLRRWRAEFGDRAIVVRHQQPLAALHAAEVTAQVAPEFGDAH